jgi:hypothetical protein
MEACFIPDDFDGYDRLKARQGKKKNSSIYFL